MNQGLERFLGDSVVSLLIALVVAALIARPSGASKSKKWLALTIGSPLIGLASVLVNHPYGGAIFFGGCLGFVVRGMAKPLPPSD